MYHKKKITQNICSEAIQASEDFDKVWDSMRKAEPLMYAHEIDKMLHLYNEISVLLFTARDRAEAELIVMHEGYIT